MTGTKFVATTCLVATLVIANPSFGQARYKQNTIKQSRQKKNIGHHSAKSSDHVKSSNKPPSKEFTAVAQCDVDDIDKVYRILKSNDIHFFISSNYSGIVQR